MSGHKALLSAKRCLRYAIMTLASAAIALCLSAYAEANVELDPNAELILDLRLDGRPLGTDILGYQHEGRFFVSLSELVESLQFPIKVDADAGLAGGWYINENREFAINLAEQLVVSGNQTFTLDPETYSVRSDGIYIETNTLEIWLPLKLQTVIQQLTLNVQPTEPIPLQERMARMSRGPINVTLTSNEPELPPMNDPYRFTGHRATNVRLGYAANKLDPDADTRRNYNYSLLSRGDLAWMTSTLSLSGNRFEDLSTARFTLERSRIQGPAQLNHIEIGDVRSGGASRGILVRGGVAGNQYQGQFADDTIPIRGNILPGWEVELYRNGVLIDFQLVGDDGRYNFPEVPLVFGENVFELRFYGPYGEERKEQITHYVGEGMFGLGSFSYEVAATQADRTTLGLEDSSSEDAGAGTYNASASIGLARQLTARTSARSFQSDGERLEAYSAGLSLSAMGAQTRASYSYTPESLDSATASVTSRIGTLGWGASYSHFFTDRLDAENIPENRQLWRANLNANLSQFRVPFNLNLRFTKQQQTTSGDISLGYTTRLPFGTRFSQGFNWSRNDRREIDGDLTHSATTALSLATSTGPWSLRLNSNFNLEPETNPGSLSGSARLRVEQNLAMAFEARHTPGNDLTSYSAGYNWLFDTLLLTPRVTYDSEERWGGFLSVSTSFSTRPATYTPYVDRLSQTSHGGVASRVFLDKDGNGIFDPEDDPIPGAKVIARQGFRSGVSGENGVAYLPRLSEYRSTDIVLDTQSLPELDMTATHAGNSVTPRPGHWTTIDFPVIQTMDLEGIVRKQQESGKTTPANRVTIELVDNSEEVISRQRTAFDGMFIYTRVPPGTYHLRLAESANARLISSPGTIVVESDGGVIRGLDMLVVEEQVSRGLAPLSDDAVTPEPEPLRSIVPDSQSSPEAQPSFLPTPEAEPENADWLVQLGAFGNPENAENLWQDLSSRLPQLLAEKTPVYRRNNARNLTILMVPISGPELQARNFCQKLEARQVACLVKMANR